MTAISDGVFASDILRRSVPYRILVPTGYAESPKHFPTLYLLHGLFGSFENWTTLTDVTKFAAGRDLIVVMPDGGDRWYTDSMEAGGDRYESFLISEFVPYIESCFRTVRDRRGRGVAGNSMGGFGAVKAALKHPHFFSFAGSMSGVFDAADKTEQNPGPEWEALGPSISKIFGPNNSETRSENDLLKITRDLVRKGEANLPYLYFDCGVDDPFLEANQIFAEALYGSTIDHVYHELPGGHDWDYWNERIERVLEIAECMLVRPRGMKLTAG